LHIVIPVPNVNPNKPPISNAKLSRASILNTTIGTALSAGKVVVLCTWTNWTAPLLYPDIVYNVPALALTTLLASYAVDEAKVGFVVNAVVLTFIAVELTSSSAIITLCVPPSALPAPIGITTSLILSWLIPNCPVALTCSAVNSPSVSTKVSPASFLTTATTLPLVTPSA